jgi:YVTN family beta-propeller protein
VRNRIRYAWYLPLACLLFQPAVPAQEAPSYVLSKTVALGAPDRWDYVAFDSSSHRVFVAHGDRLTVVDGHDGAILGQVEGFPGGTHGIAIVPSAGRGYTDDGRAGEAGSFDLKTLQAEKRLKTDAGADGLAYDSASGHVFVINGNSGTVTVIDPAADQVIANVTVGGKLEFGVGGGNGKVYVNGEELQQIVRIDAKSNQVDARWAIPTCSKPHGLAFDPRNHRLFASCVNSILVVVDSDSGSVVATVPIGRGTDAAAFDPKRKLVFSSNGQDGTLSIIRQRDPNTYVSLGNMPTAATARTLSLDPDTGRIYLLAAELQPPDGSQEGSGRRNIVPGSLRLLFLDPH